ncbi:hypothetical protein PSA85_04795 [Limosilactobacillus reuteri]|nr:hypothetical protein [Limosilactobacillus reuteri]MDD1406693.1 hypothetical protein [Limosilactobacillus reuteri]
MNNSIKTILGIKDPYLKLDEKNFDNPIEDQPNQIIVHLIQTYPMHCPKCGHLMCKMAIKQLIAWDQSFTLSQQSGRLMLTPVLKCRKTPI